MKVAFFGHSDATDSIRADLKVKIKKMKFFYKKVAKYFVSLENSRTFALG